MENLKKKIMKKIRVIFIFFPLAFWESVMYMDKFWSEETVKDG